MARNNPHPSLLSFTGSIDPSVFAMFALYPENKIRPIEVDITTVRGTISNHSNEDIEEQLSKNEKSPNNPNIQRIEIAHLPTDSETLLIKGSVNFLANSLGPNACNEDGFTDAHTKFIKAYKEKGGYRTLAKRYFMNLINGAILWRNRYGKNVQTEIEYEGNHFIFQADDIDFKNSLSINSIKTKDKQKEAEAISDTIARALKGEFGQYACLQLNINAQSTLGFGQDVYPSQEFSEKSIRDRAGQEISKVLAKMELKNGKKQAVMHSQKIGNAIRTIDDWYEKDAPYPLAVEPYGVDQAAQKALRKSNNFYKYIVKLEQLTDQINQEDHIPNTAHFVAACFVRGGVFSKAKEEKKK
jgi:CRISPR-associated protein Csy3